MAKLTGTGGVGGLNRGIEFAQPVSTRATISRQGLLFHDMVVPFYNLGLHLAQCAQRGFNALR
ncbi:hypothetical protein [Chromobacterium violaceum]|uniref:hypothetical protein n=1 Tax=Chromobacterium violaceum TaxID=536 RepID=UPI0012D36067|nr:hypothetical protein [Chromobacterium violaceum]